MKKMNKKGFTLIELLAVIVVLAVLILIATTAVIPQMNRARKQAFITEATTIYNAAKEYFLYQEMQGVTLNNPPVSPSTTPASCVDISKMSGGKYTTDSLIGNYVDEKGKTTYSGTVQYNSNGNYIITLTDGKNYSIAVEANDLGNINETAVFDGSTIQTSYKYTPSGATEKTVAPKAACS